MTPEQFRDAMKQIRDDNSWNTEAMHCRMDALMCEALSGLGYQEGVEIFEAQDKWYA